MKFLFTRKTTLTLTAGFCLLASNNLMANSCTKADIDYYLQRGFTHNQVVRLCANSPAQNPVRLNTSSPVINNTSRDYQTPSNSLQAGLSEDRVYFETVLKQAKTASLTPSSLSYVSRECIKYGEENLAGLKSKVCANTRVTVNFKGLQILKAAKGVFLIRDQQMLVQGDIQREYLDIDTLPPAKQAVIRAQLPSKPRRIDLPVRKGIDPKRVADKLKKYITP